MTLSPIKFHMVISDPELIKNNGKCPSCCERLYGIIPFGGGSWSECAGGIQCTSCGYLVRREHITFEMDERQ